jgi:hypothetical protein
VKIGCLLTDVLMSCAAMVLVAVHLVQVRSIFRAYDPLVVVGTLVLDAAIIGDMVLAHWQHRRPWWAVWMHR